MEQSAKTALIIGVILLLIVGGGTAYMLSRNNDEKNSSNSSQVDNNADENNEQASQNIVELASGNPELSTLVAAVEAAGLADTLANESASFTVFAPTNAAFDKLPAGTVDTLLQAENRQQLAGILTYHVVEGNVTSDQLSNGQKIKTVAGGELTVQITDGMVYVVDAAGDRAQVTTADVRASNGVVHVIDNVLMPE
jgi:uncharacterized surface protein with fasciclin (FAS1) repeats